MAFLPAFCFRSNEQSLRPCQGLGEGAGDRREGQSHGAEALEVNSAKFGSHFCLKSQEACHLDLLL